MFKKSLATALLVASVPAVASASWFLSTQAMDRGGTISTRNNPSQDVLAGSVFRSYTTSAGIPLTVTADGNHTIATVTVNGTVVNNPASPYSVTIPGGYTDKSVSAVFAVKGLSVGAGIDNGSVTPATVGNITKGFTLLNDLTFTFSPKVGYKITGVSGVPADLVPAPTKLAGDVNERIQVRFPAGYTFSSDLNLQAATQVMVAEINPILAKTVVAGTTVTLSATGNSLMDMTGAAWEYVSGPDNQVTTSTVQTSKGPKVVQTVTPGPSITLDTTQPGKASFTAPSKTGQYKFKVTANGDTKLAAVNVVATLADASTSCQSCHTATGIRTVADTSSHSSCQACHFGGTGHPGSVNAGTVNAATFVVSSDSVTNGNGTAAAKGTSFCASCHGVTGNAAQAVPGLTTHQDKACGDCHTSSHETHVASAACQACHATVHTAATMGTQGCLDCHDGHKPTFGTKPLVGAVSHPAVTLYTFEEVGYQMNGGQPVPVQVDANGKGMPYSPKMTCGTSGCHVINGVNYTYDKISDHAFHSAQGRNEFQDTADGKLDARKNKPWTQSTAMVGKW